MRWRRRHGSQFAASTPALLSLAAAGLSLRSDAGGRILDAVDVEFTSDELVVIAGLNGAGKSMLVRCLLGLTKPSEGRVLLDGKDIASGRRRLRQRVGLVFQESHLQIIGQTVAEDVEITPRALGLGEEEVRRLADRAMAVVGLESKADCDPHRLSGGERRRLCLAAALAHNPDIVFLDEPFVSLDKPSASAFYHAITQARAAGHGVVVVTHDIERFLPVADRFVLLDRGRVAAADAPLSVLPIAEELGLIEATRRAPATGDSAAAPSASAVPRSHA